MERPSKMREAPWFPVYENQIEDIWFNAFTDAEKVFYFTLQSEFNERRDSFYRADVEYAAMLRLSVHKIREARRKFGELALIAYEPGHQGWGRNKATTYTYVHWSSVQKDRGQFSQVHRFTFQCMLALLRSGELGHREVAMYVHLAHLWWCKAVYLQRDHLDLSKRLLAGKTGIRKAAESLQMLRETVLRGKGANLFEIHDRHTLITISGLREFQDPSQNEVSLRSARRFDEDIRSRAAQMRAGLTDCYDHRLDTLFGESP